MYEFWTLHLSKLAIAFSIYLSETSQCNTLLFTYLFILVGAGC